MIVPVISEKAVALSEQRVYSFYVPKNSTKQSVARAISNQFEVTVTAVRMNLVKGKATQVRVKRGSRVVNGRRNDRKKAYVTVAEGQTINIYEGA